MTSYLGNLLTRARVYVNTYTETSPTVTKARDTAHTLKQLSSYVYNGGPIDTLFHDAKEPISDIIRILTQLTNSEKVFESGYHFVGHRTFEELEENMKWVLDNPKGAAKIAEHAYKEVTKNHLIINRVNQILEVVNA